MEKRFKLTLALGAIAAFGLANSAKAVIVNGGFESGDLTGWTPLGDVSVVGPDFNPPEGSNAGFLTNIPIANNSFSGTAATTSISSLESFANLASGSLSGASNVKSGSAIKQTFFATAGDTITFDYNFLTNEASTGNQDFGFYALQGPGGGSAALHVIGTPLTATTLPPLTPSQAGIFSFLNGGVGHETGNTLVSFVVGTTGNYTLAFGVTNVNDSTVSSGLIIDALAGATGTSGGGGGGGGGGSSVPLPAAVFVGPLGAMLAGAASKRMRRKGVPA